MLMIGYVVYWLELFILNKGNAWTSPTAWCLFAILLIIVKWRDRTVLWQGAQSLVKAIQEQDFIEKMILWISIGLSMVMLGAVVYAYLMPVHLVQETDALVYHITIPRQHLLQGSFDHLSWSTADLYLLPLDLALAPYWLATAYPNKIPQLFFFIALVFMVGRLTFRLSRGSWLAVCLSGLAVLGTHQVGIQAGTAMLDLAICYLFLAAIESFWSRNYVMAGIEMAFCFWSKGIMPLFILGLLVLIIVVYFALKALKFEKMTIGFEDVTEWSKEGWMKVFSVFLVASLFIGGPFVVKTLKVAGTPLYPFAVGQFGEGELAKDNAVFYSLKAKAEQAIETRDHYGSGRSVIEFIRHLWLISVPEKGVNNRYDYPVGLIYLLMVGPFVYFFWRSIRSKEIPILPILVISFWMIWWMGSHQTRFLYIPLMLMVVVVVAHIKKPSIILLGAIFLAVGFTSLSVVRAHKGSWGKKVEDVLRQKDKRLIEMAKMLPQGATMAISDFDCAYATFPVVVKGSDSVFVLKTKE